MMRIDYVGPTPPEFQTNLPSRDNRSQMRRGCTTVALNDLFAPILDRQLLGVFETVVVATPSGIR